MNLADMPAPKDRGSGAFLKTAEHSISNEDFYKMQEFYLALKRKSLAGEVKYKEGLKGIASSDILALGSHLESSVCRVCGDFIELHISTSSFVTGKGGGQKNPLSIINRDDAERHKRNIIARSAKRAEKNVRRLVNTNRLGTMWTLTFAPDSSRNREIYRTSTKAQQSDISFVKSAWRKFYLQVSEDYPGWKWLIVYELHDSPKTSDVKRRTWHLHFATDTRLEWEYVFNTWEWGNVRFDDFSKPKKGGRKSPVRNPGAYMSKYIGKAFDESNYHVKRYSRSRNMEVPEKTDLEGLLRRFPGLQGLSIIFDSGREFEYESRKYYSKNITFARK